MDGDRLARGFGWLGVGLGLAELTFADDVCRRLQARRHPGLLRALGGRELVTGLGLLSAHERRPWQWARVAGDALTLSLLGTTLSQRARAPRWRLAALATLFGLALVDVLAATPRPHARRARPAEGPGAPGPVAGDVPMESWRGSGLAEDVGVWHGEAAREEDEEEREERMRAAREQLGLPDPELQRPRTD